MFLCLLPVNCEMIFVSNFISIIIIILVTSVHFLYINVPSQQPDVQKQKHFNIQTQKTKDNMQDTWKQIKTQQKYI